MKIWLCTLLVIIGALDAIRASEMPNHPLTFNNWKRVQIHNSETDVVTKSKEITLLKNKMKEVSIELSTLEELTKKLEVEQYSQKKNLEKLQFSKELTFEEYFDVYLKKYAKNPEALKFIAQRLSKSSVAYLLERSMVGEKKSVPKLEVDPVIAKPALVPEILNK